MVKLLADDKFRRVQNGLQGLKGPPNQSRTRHASIATPCHTS